MDVNQTAIGIGLALGLCGLGVGLGEGIATNGGVNGMARQPEAGGRIQALLLIGLAFMELIFLLTWVVALIGKIK